MTFEVRRPLDSGLAAVVVGAGRDAAPLDHLVPHNALEWALYLGVLAVIVAVLIYEWHNRNRNSIPGLRVRRLRRTRREPAPTAADGAAASGPDDSVDDNDSGH